MKLVTRLKIFGIFATCLLFILGITTYWGYAQVDMELARNTVAGNIVKDTFTLTILNNDYLRTHRERARVQWLAQYALLHKQITSYSIKNAVDRQIIEQLQQEQTILLKHFNQLQATLKKDQTFIQIDQERLDAQLSIDMQTIVSLGTTLADNNSQQLAIIRRTTIGFILGVVILLGVMLLFTYFLFAKNISQSVRKLIQGTKEVANGNLSFRFKEMNNDEFGQLANSFNTMARQLQELDQAKNEFLALASHELRTPMTAIKGFTSMILRGDYGGVNPDLIRPLSHISVSTERQIHLINNLLDVSRLQTGQVMFTLTDFSIEQVTNEIVGSLQPIAEQKGIYLTTSVDSKIIVHADRNWVGQILNNLIGNALKFTDKGSVSIASKLDGRQVFLIITDTGFGIKKKDQQKLFKKFQQLSSEITGKPAGSGLGLYISREIARKMGGDVRIEKSQPGKGSVFVLAIPLTE